MHSSLNIALQKKLHKLSLYFAIAVMLIGIFVLLGWQFHIDIFKRPLSHLSATNPLSALSFIFCSVSLLLYLSGNARWKWAAAFLATSVLLAGMARLIDFSGIGLTGIDQWVFPSKLSAYKASNISNHMAPTTAINFILAGATLLLFNYETKKERAPFQYLALVMALINIFCLLGYIYRVNELQSAFGYRPTAFYTAVGFLFLSFAILLGKPGKGFIKEFITPYTGSEMGRRLIPVAILVPVILGYLRLLGGWDNHYTTEFGVTILVSSIVIIFVVYTFYNTKLLNKKDILKQQAEDELKSSQEIFSTLFYKSPTMNVISDAVTGKYIDVNDSFANFIGLKKEDIIGKNALELGIIADTDERTKILQEVAEQRSVKDKIIKLNVESGQARWVSVNINTLQIYGKSCFLSTMSDVTASKKGEEKFRNLLEVAPDAVVIVDNKGFIKLINVQTELMFEYKREELLDQKLEILIPERFRKEHPGYRNKFFESPRTRGMGIGLELYGLKKSGKEFPVEISLSPLETEEGMLVSAAIRDITERKKAEEKFRDLLESAPDAIVIVNEKGIIQLVNVQTEQLFGYLRGEMIGKPVELLMPFRFDKNHMKHRDNYFKSPKVRQMGEGLELFGKKKSGDEFPIEISLSPLETEEGLLVSAAIRDISEKKQLENQIREANVGLERKVKQRTEELERKNKDLEQFAYVASHDLQEPLRTTSSFVELFKEKYMGKLDEDADTMLNYIIQSSDRMKVLIKDLLDYSRIGRKIVIEEVDCNKILEDVLADLSTSIQETSAGISIEQLPVIRGYPTEMKQLFQNLISNAIKFRKKDIAPLIHIMAEKKKGYWQFSIADNGIGIEEKHRDRIFVIFQRLHTRTEYEGSGIGLSHCKKIAELHGGKIWVDSEPGQGSAFHFTIHEI